MLDTNQWEVAMLARGSRKVCWSWSGGIGLIRWFWKAFVSSSLPLNLVENSRAFFWKNVSCLVMLKPNNGKTQKPKYLHDPKPTGSCMGYTTLLTNNRSPNLLCSLRFGSLFFFFKFILLKSMLNESNQQRVWIQTWVQVTCSLPSQLGHHRLPEFTLIFEVPFLFNLLL